MIKMVIGWHLKHNDVYGLVEIARQVDRSKLKKIALLLGSPEECDECGTTLDEMVASYNHIPSKDATITITSEKKLMQLASGGGDCRRMKNALRTAMTMMIIHEYVKNTYDHTGFGTAKLPIRLAVM